MSSFRKIGPQLLSSAMMKLVFPFDKKVMDDIERIRDTAQKEGGVFADMLQVDEKNAVMAARGYSNAISILGSRGSGKTSIIMTLRDELQRGKSDAPTGKENSISKNIIMPFLAPQDFAEEEPLLGWIVSQLLKLGEKTVQEIKDSDQGDLFYKNQAHASQYNYGEYLSDSIEKYMDQMLDAFRLRSQNAIDGRSLQVLERDQVYYYMDSVKQDTELQTIMLKLISEIISYHRIKLQGLNSKHSEKKQGQNLEPLIIFTIDDLDLTPNRSSEVLELVLRYLQHPNVVVLCGWNYELFLNHLSIELLKNQGVLSKDMLDTNFSFNDVFMTRYRKQTTALITARRLALDSLKKAFPPAQRYEIRGLTLAQRAEFMYAEEGNETATKLFDTIESAIQSCVHNPDAKKKATSFLKDSRGVNLLVYMRIFDNKARGLINVHRAFASLKDSQDELEKQTDKDEWDIADEVRVLFDTLLFSNTRFAPYRRGIRDMVQIKSVYAARTHGEKTSDGKLRLEYYCDYEAVKKLYKEYIDDAAQVRLHESNPFEARRIIEQEYDYFSSVLIDTFVLLNFMENLLHAITQTDTSVHGGREFSDLLNTLNEPIVFSKQPQDDLIRAIELSGVEELRLFPNTSDFALNLLILNKYEDYDFEMRRYHFTGFRSLEKTFDLARYLLTNGNAQSGEDALDSEMVRLLLRDDSEWLKTVLTLFRDLYPSEKNAKRYGAYVCFLNSLNGDRIEASKRANVLVEPKKCQSVEKMDSSLKTAKPEVSEYDDEKLDLIVRWLRVFDRNRQRFMQTARKTRIKRGHVNLTKLNKEDIQAYYRAQAFEKWAEAFDYRLSNEIDFPTISRLVDPIISYVDYDDADLALDIPIQYVQDTANRALAAADRVIEQLLDILKSQMQFRVQKNYYRSKKKRNGLEGSQHYLAHASKAVWKYVVRWELGFDGWGQKEYNACFTIANILQRNYLGDKAEDVREILEMGSDLEKTGRSRYGNRVSNLRGWVLSHDNYFDEEESDQLREALKVLTSVLSQTRRSLPVENSIYNILMEIGDMIAHENGQICQKEYRRISGEPSNERENADNVALMKYWPVSARYDEKMKQLNTTFNKLTPKQNRSQGSLFDTDYDDLEFYF